MLKTTKNYEMLSLLLSSSLISIRTVGIILNINVIKNQFLVIATFNLLTIALKISCEPKANNEPDSAYIIFSEKVPVVKHYVY